MIERLLPRLSPPSLLLLACTVLTLAYNKPFWDGVVSAMPMGGPMDVLRIAGFASVLVCLQFILLLPFANRFSIRPLLALLFLIAAGVSYFTTYYGVYFDTNMVDNVLQTDTAEASELLTAGLVVHLSVFGVLPAIVIWRWPLQERIRAAALKSTVGWTAGVSCALALALVFSYQGLSSLMRRDTELRYLITPANLVVSSIQALRALEGGDATRHPLGEDAHRVVAAGQRPRLLVLVVGETVRAANWGLSGYSRETTPLLSARDVINFTDVAACGTSTAVSLPCMFSPVGRTDFTRADARGSESMLDVLQRAGYRVVWLDNQSGCKHVCDGVEFLPIDRSLHPDLCADDNCLDAVLVRELARLLPSVTTDTVVVLHQLGNHGPAYSTRYPEEFRVFRPTCDVADLARCSRDEVVNSYDNAVLYTDAVIDAAIQALESTSELDSALIYLSDHGESLGEGGIYLHGLPYVIAPDEQTHVPMVWWSSPGFDDSFGLSHACLAGLHADSLSHDYLFHSMLGVLGVESLVIKPELDFTQACRAAGPGSRLAGASH